MLIFFYATPAMYTVVKSTAILGIELLGRPSQTRNNYAQRILA